MTRTGTIQLLSTLLLALTVQPILAQNQSRTDLEFFGQKFSFTSSKPDPRAIIDPTENAISAFYNNNLKDNYLDVIESLRDYQNNDHPDDWLFYQLIRKVSQQISPKESNYYQYTIFKWYFLTRSGFDAILRISGKKMLLYIQCNENIYNIPSLLKNNVQYVCLNYHDYGKVDFLAERFIEAGLPSPGVLKTFSYKVTHIPDFKATEYLEKDLHFTFNENDYHFRVKLSQQTEKMFANYPVVDYESFLNIPLSKDTYNSLIPQLKKNLKGMSVRNGIDYLMRFTRYAFLFEPDRENFGTEKRLSPEQTLFNDYSDCEDRVALFFCLVKEIYDLPMIVLTFPSHVTIAVEFDKSRGKTIEYQGRSYTVCEPTPQKEDLMVGQLAPELLKTPYQVAYVYQPEKNNPKKIP